MESDKNENKHIYDYCFDYLYHMEFMRSKKRLYKYFNNFQRANYVYSTKKRRKKKQGHLQFY